MNYKELFSKKECETLESAVEIAFQTILAIDWRIEPKKNQSLEVLCGHSEKLKRKLLTI